MNLYFMRHGIALPADDPAVAHDGDRPLTQKGVKRARKAARGLRRLNIPFDAILTSPVLRARQTADILAGALGAEALVEEIASLKPNSTFQQLMADLTRYQERKDILLVSHEPFLSEVLSSLLIGQSGPRLHVEFKKGALCRTELDSLSPLQPGKLHWFLSPKQLRLLGERLTKN